MLSPSQARHERLRALSAGKNFPPPGPSELHLDTDNVLEFAQDLNHHRSQKTPLKIFLNDISGVSQEYVGQILCAHRDSTFVSALAVEQIKAFERQDRRRFPISASAAVLAIVALLQVLATAIWAR